jgi:hypothetical protein
MRLSSWDLDEGSQTVAGQKHAYNSSERLSLPWYYTRT